MYQFYLDGVLLPVTPSSLTMKMGDKDETVDLINGEVFTVMNYPGLTEWEFEFLLPETEVPYIHPNASFNRPQEYLDHLESLKTSRKPFQFIMVRSLTRTNKNLDATQDTNVKVSLKDMSVTEDAGEYGNARMVKVVLRQYKTYKTERVSVSSLKNGASVSTGTKDRVLYMVKEGTYVVQKGDTLRSICAKYPGLNDEKYAEALAAYQKKPPLEFTLEPLAPGMTLQMNVTEIKALYEKITVNSSTSNIWEPTVYSNAVANGIITLAEVKTYLQMLDGVVEKPSSDSSWTIDVLKKKADQGDLWSFDLRTKNVTLDMNVMAWWGLVLIKLIDQYDSVRLKGYNNEVAQLQKDVDTLHKELVKCQSAIADTEAQIEVLEELVEAEKEEAEKEEGTDGTEKPEETPNAKSLRLTKDYLDTLQTTRKELEAEIIELNGRSNQVYTNLGKDAFVLGTKETTFMNYLLDEIKYNTLYATTLTSWAYEIGLIKEAD